MSIKPEVLKRDGNVIYFGSPFYKALKHQITDSNQKTEISAVYQDSLDLMKDRLKALEEAQSRLNYYMSEFDLHF